MGRRVRASITLLVSAIVFAVLVGCSVVPEEKIVRDFFRASRLRDNAALGAFATIYFDPTRDGQVTTFKVLSVSPDRSAPLPLRKYDDAFDEASTAQKAFAKEKYAFQQANLEAIERVEKLEAKNSPVSRKDATVQATWSKWRDDEARHLKAVSDARVALSRMKGVAELSLSQPNGPTPDVTHYVGDLIEKDVTVDASVRMPDGQTVQKTLVVTSSRTVMKNEKGETLTGRWIITGVKEAQARKTS
jgi:hypothetical protein